MFIASGPEGLAADSSTRFCMQDAALLQSACMQAPQVTVINGTLGGRELRAEVVHERLRDAILRGELEVGAPMSQVKLAEQLGVSRTPLREAVRMLQHEGLILTERNRRARVAPLSAADVEQLYAQRLVLEALALRLSVPRFAARDLDELRRQLDRMHELEDERATEDWEQPH